MKPVTLRQQELLVEFMANHKELALGRVRSKEGRALSARLWTELASILNSDAVDPSAYRSPKDWNKFYNDYKCRIKNKTRRIAQSQRQTGGGPSDAPPLSEVEERLCAIIGPDKFQTLPVRQETVPGSNSNDLIFQHEDNLEDNLQHASEPIVVEEFELIENIEEPVAQEPQHEVIQEELFEPTTTTRQQKRKAKEPTENEVDKIKNLLSNLEKERIEVSRSQVQVQLDRNKIEREKITAINNLAKAAWAIAGKFKTETRKRARVSSSSSSEDD